MPEQPPILKRLSKGILQNNPKPRTSSFVIQPASVDLEIESPPLMLYGPESSSDGALASGTLKITVNEDSLNVKSFKMSLNKEMSRRKPFHQGCPECANEVSELKEWNFLSSAVTTLPRGVHTFPFSYLFPGDCHATTHGNLYSLEYWLRVRVTTEGGEQLPLKLARQLTLKRAVFPSDRSRHSIRVFPPTNIKADCNFPSVIHPIGEHTFSLRLDGAIARNSDTQVQTHWKLRKLTWTLEERSKQVAPACAKHEAKAGPKDAKKFERVDTKTIGSGGLTSGWKANYNDAEGCIELEFPFSSNLGQKVTCNTKDGQGTEISHVMEVEMIVFEEQAPLKRLSQTSPTGGARVLRMHFDMNLTERAGMGVSWTQERPPLYGDVPPSPPTYKNGNLSDCPEYNDVVPLETIGLSRNSGSPTPVVRRRLSMTDLEQENADSAAAPDLPEESAIDEVEDGDIYD